MTPYAVGYAIAAALFIAIGSALQHHAAAGEPGYRGGVGLVLRLARRKRWVAGLAAAGVGTLLHAAALRHGALAVVEPLLVMNLALALPARALLDRERPSVAHATAAAILGGGVAIFVIAARPSQGHSAPDTRTAMAVIVAGSALAGLGALIAARTRSGPVAGFTLGLAAGTLYGVGGGVLKAAVRAVEHDPVAAITGWPLWILVTLSAWAFVMHQLAYARAPLRLSLPVLSVAGPLAGVAFGALAFGEIPAHGLLAVAGQLFGLAVMLASVIALSRSEEPLRPAGIPLDALRHIDH